MEILGYIIIAFSILFTLGWSLKIREKARNEQATEKSMELQGFLMTVSIILIFALKLSASHLLWMIPVSFILGLLSMTTPLKFLWIFSSIYFSFWYIGISNPGRNYYVNGEYDKAIESFKEQIAKKPTVEAYFNLALAYGKKGMYSDEIYAYNQAIQLNPKRAEIYFNLGVAYDETENQDLALHVINEAINLKPDYLNAHYKACTIHIKLGDFENAKREFEIVKKLDVYAAEELKKKAKFV